MLLLACCLQSRICMLYMSCRYKDARTMQALEGTLPSMKQRSSKAHRKLLSARLLKPRLFMAQRAIQAASETGGLICPSDEITQSPDHLTAGIREEVEQQRHYFGQGSGNVSGGAGSVSGGRQHVAGLLPRQYQSARKGSSTLARHMRSVSRKPSASLEPVQSNRTSKKRRSGG